MEFPFRLVALLALGIDLQLALDRALIAAVSLVEHVALVRGKVCAPLCVL